MVTGEVNAAPPSNPPVPAETATAQGIARVGLPKVDVSAFCRTVPITRLVAEKVNASVTLPWIILTLPVAVQVAGSSSTNAVADTNVLVKVVILAHCHGCFLPFVMNFNRTGSVRTDCVHLNPICWRTRSVGSYRVYLWGTSDVEYFPVN